MPTIQTEHYYPKTKAQWRKWLEKNHNAKQSVWLVMYKKSSGKPSVSWSDAVDEALCFGWIDSLKKKLDEQRSIQFFSKRKAKSTWSKINKAKVEQLIKNGLMYPAGQECIEVAKQNGWWTILDEVEELIIPPDLEKAFNAAPGSKELFSALSRSAKKAMLQRLILTQRPETRQKRIDEIVQMASERT